MNEGVGFGAWGSGQNQIDACESAPSPACGGRNPSALPFPRRVPRARVLFAELAL